MPGAPIILPLNAPALPTWSCHHPATCHHQPLPSSSPCHHQPLPSSVPAIISPCHHQLLPSSAPATIQPPDAPALHKFRCNPFSSPPTCSLNPGTPRFAFSVEWEMDEDGRIYKQWAGKSVICSTAKLAYPMVQVRAACTCPHAPGILGAGVSGRALPAGMRPHSVLCVYCGCAEHALPGSECCMICVCPWLVRGGSMPLVLSCWHVHCRLCGWRDCGCLFEDVNMVGRTAAGCLRM